MSDQPPVKPWKFFDPDKESWTIIDTMLLVGVGPFALIALIALIC